MNVGGIDAPRCAATFAGLVYAGVTQVNVCIRTAWRAPRRCHHVPLRRRLQPARHHRPAIIAIPLKSGRSADQWSCQLTHHHHHRQFLEWLFDAWITGDQPYTQSVRSAAPYKYILSLPERAIRSLGALSGGLLREIGNVALPASVRRTTLYRTMVEVALRFLIEEVGQVEGVYPSEGRLAENFLLKRTASHGIELLGILAFHASPVWVLAALADATGGGRKLILEIADALKEEGLLERDARFETMDQVLLGLEKTSDHMATTLNMPPVDIAGLRREWDQLKQELATIPPKKVPALERIEGVWEESAELPRNSRGDRSSACRRCWPSPPWPTFPPTCCGCRAPPVPRCAAPGACSAIRFWTTTRRRSGKSRRTGFFAYWSREFRPYLRGAAEQFAPDHESLTERLLKRS